MINIPKGTKDMLPKDSYKWQKIREVVMSLADKYNLKEISTPGFESTELFVHSDGDSSDIVTKEMYTFLDKGNRSITLKPEGTAGAVEVKMLLSDAPAAYELNLMNHLDVVGGANKVIIFGAPDSANATGSFVVEELTLTAQKIEQ